MFVDLHRTAGLSQIEASSCEIKVHVSSLNSPDRLEFEANNHYRSSKINKPPKCFEMKEASFFKPEIQ